MVAVLVVPVMAVMHLPTVAAEPDVADDTVDFVCEELQNEMQKDPELAELVTKYEEVFYEQSLSEDELVDLIAEEESEKAKVLGISVQLSTSTVIPQWFRLCIRPITGPGKVNWNFTDPGQAGAKYSVLPENGGALVWASPPQQNIDAIYRTSWGNCNAYKIPNSAIATFSDADNAEICYNAFACSALGHCPKWVNPCDGNSAEDSWPDDSLT
ncbi:MAG: hypothetical protein GFH27_549297n56 [Chloroflexi bacterium AL-W]|nr:hypothetical protein [Chloroflexi bacterium AL-N1]NOK68580.1 hypothetical protein [Chloroflexi bacterium AL-N10]NOK76066.1 hypothetical protein [Chloroflexi bacterium AL-N5]NOK82539.1 hypothetical protein [Chloroflexi bacterium AL-W]NOK92849.1 hypothetical protein [Chloroflexi bacterium AL-N15]